MKRQDHDPSEKAFLEAEMLRSMRLMTPQAQEDLVELAIAYAELFPRRPTLKLVASNVGGAK